MPEKKPRRASLLAPLKRLSRNSLDGSNHTNRHDNSGYMSLHPTKPHQASRTSIRTSSDNYRISYSYSYRNVTPPSIQGSFQSQIPHSPDHDTKYLAPSSRTRLLPSQTQRFSPCSSVSSTVPDANPAQTSMPSLHQRWSRLPTPAYQPDSGYSHEMYKRERRRSVFSSLGKKYTSFRRSFDSAVMLEATGKRTTSDSGLKIISVQSPVTKSWTGSGTTISSNKSEKSSFSRRRMSTMIPLPKSSSMLSLLSSSQPPKSAVEITTELKGGPSSDEDAAWPLPLPPLRNDRKRPSLRKVRVKLHSFPLAQRHGPEQHAYSPHNEISYSIARTKDEMSPKKIWTTEGRQGLRSTEDISLATGTRGFEEQTNGSSTDLKAGMKAGSSQIPILHSPAEQAAAADAAAGGGEGGGRSRDRTERMVSEAKPNHYWLGRFVTLTNAFHYEDSFNEPDAATGFGMLSIFSHPLADCVDGPSYRAKRAFRVLENVCMTEEASLSLRRFREEYVLRYGGRWLEY